MEELPPGRRRSWEELFSSSLLIRVMSAAAMGDDDRCQQTGKRPPHHELGDFLRVRRHEPRPRAMDLPGTGGSVPCPNIAAST
jgi:hypothetical protein